MKLLIEDLFFRCQSSRSSKQKKKESASGEDDGEKLPGKSDSAMKPQTQVKISKNKVSPMVDFSEQEKSESPKRQKKKTKFTPLRANLGDDESFDDDDEYCYRNVYYEPLLKLPRLELLVDWDWNPANQRFNHYFAYNPALGDRAPLEFIARNLRLDFALNIPKHDEGVSNMYGSATPDKSKKSNFFQNGFLTSRG